MRRTAIQNEIDEIMAALDAKYSRNELRELFLGRQNDSLFEPLGRLVVGRMTFAPHVYVWVGYEYATRSKWCESFYEG